MQPLALKYRPGRFIDLVGQKATRAVLARLVEKGELPPSMIFAGVRGTGKTSAARIVAKAINCENRERFEPCLECGSCVAVHEERAPFVVEVDAASNSGAAEMRVLVDDARFTSGGAWKVYVLDEVHSVSSQGFQVLLKTLEEPPPRTSFILVTTEPEKIPDTIHARSMLFRFSKITPDGISNRLAEVAEEEGIELTDQGARWITDAANGGMRDALMMLEQVASLGRAVDEALLIGLFGEQGVGPWIEALLSGNPARAVLVADEMVAAHGSVGAMIDRALLTLREALLAQAGHRRMPTDLENLRLGRDQVLEMIGKLWSMRVQVRQLGPDDRAAVVALSAELARKPVVKPEKKKALTAAEIEEAVGGGSE